MQFLAQCKLNQQRVSGYAGATCVTPPQAPPLPASPTPPPATSTAATSSLEPTTRTTTTTITTDVATANERHAPETGRLSNPQEPRTPTVVIDRVAVHVEGNNDRAEVNTSREAIVPIDGQLLLEYLWGGGGSGGGLGEIKEDADGEKEFGGAYGENSDTWRVIGSGSIDDALPANTSATATSSSPPPSLAQHSMASTATLPVSTHDDGSSQPASSSSSSAGHAKLSSAASFAEARAAAAEAAREASAPAVSRDLRRRYLAQSLARIVGAAGVIREARRAGCGDTVATVPGSAKGQHNGAGGAGVVNAEEGIVGGSGRVSDRARNWNVAQEQSAAAVEAFDALDRGVEELLAEVSYR